MTSTKATDRIFPISTFLSDLPATLLPQSLVSPESGSIGRLVIVGDVHGMRKSLEALLDKAGFDKRNGDHLVLVGDLVNKGPDSPGVVDLALKLGASAVRGNHDNAVLKAAAGIRATRDTPQHSEDLAGTSTVAESLKDDPPAVPNVDNSVKGPSAATQRTASVLSAHQLDWLASLPLILRVKLPQQLKSSLGDTLLVVHAGLVPGIPLEEQDPHAVMHMRSVVRTVDNNEGLTPAEMPGEESWVGEWDQWQDRLASKTTVVFGHDAKRRLQLGRYAIGLDSGCLYGHKLSAAVIAVVDGEITHQVIQVDCVDAPVVPTASVEEGDRR